MRKHVEWLGKPLKYGTRRLMPGDTHPMPGRLADMFIKRKMAREVRPVAELPPLPADLAQPADLTALRAEYTAKLGKRPFPGWGAEVLREKIANAG